MEEAALRILIVEDDPVSCAVMRKLMEPFGAIDSAADGAEALGKFRARRNMEEPYDLVMLDIMMPGLNGREVLREIRLGEEREGLAEAKCAKIVMVTALSSLNDVVESFRGQCDGYLTKPVSKRQLEQVLGAVGLK